MLFIDFLAFIASIILFMYLTRKKYKENSLKQKEEFSVEDENRENIRSLMDRLNISLDEAGLLDREVYGKTSKPKKKSPPPVSSKVEKSQDDVMSTPAYSLPSSVDPYTHSTLNPYEIHAERNRSRGTALLKIDKKKMMIIHEILQKPKSLQ